MEDFEIYLGRKIIEAGPMSLGAYNKLRGWETPGNEDPNTQGYLVKYLDGGQPNTTLYPHYISWLPANVFKRAYQKLDRELPMDFGMALVIVKAGGRVARAGWNGKRMFIFLVPGSTFQVNRPPLLGIYPEGTTIDYHAHIDMKTADGKVVPWLASQTDMLAEDWMDVSMVTAAQ